MPVEVLLAVIAIPTTLTGIFLKYTGDQRDKDRLAYAEQRALDRAIWENHLSKSILVQSEMAKTLGGLVTQMSVMQTQNDNSMAFARDAVQSLIREIGRSQPAKDI